MPNAQPLLRRAAKRMALTVDAVLPRVPGVVVLAYHRVGARTPSPVDLDLGLFRAQTEYLAERCDVLDLPSAVELLAGGQSPERPSTDGRPVVVLTFDDGTADFADLVMPVLSQQNLPATVYLATGNLDSGDAFPQNGTPLSWGAVRDVVSTGLVTVGAHTHTHRLLDRCSADVIDDELSRCDERIEEETGERPAHFAYPKAVAGSPVADRAVRRRYASAAIAGTRPNPFVGSDVWNLLRSPIQVADAWSGFVRKVDGGMRAEDDARRAVNRVRYRGRTT